MRAGTQPRNLEGCNTRRHRNPTDVQHVYVSPATLTLQFMRALTARRALPAPHNHPSVLPRLTGSLNTTANSPMYKFSHRGGGPPLRGLLPTFVRRRRRTGVLFIFRRFSRFSSAEYVDPLTKNSMNLPVTGIKNAVRSGPSHSRANSKSHPVSHFYARIKKSVWNNIYDWYADFLFLLLLF